MAQYISGSASREEIIERTFESFEEFHFDSAFEEYRNMLRGSVNRVFEEAKLPALFERKINFSSQIRDHLSRMKNALVQEGVPEIILDSLKQHICTHINFLFYEEYIEKTVSEKLIPYCASRKAPKQWGFGSIFYWDDRWGRTFYSFWRNSIEKNDDARFQNIILQRLPAEWQHAYRMKKPATKCPYIWDDMDDEEIAKTLAGLKKPVNPANANWWIGSLAKWHGTNDDELWGKSFWAWWRSLENEGDEIFRARFLPFFPEEWQRNFTMIQTDDIEWQSMPDEKIAALLNELVRPYGLKKWGFGAVEKWFDRSSGKPFGCRFRQYWRRSVEQDGDAEFRRRILPLLNPDLRLRYRPVGYEIPFHPLLEEDRNAAGGTDDMDALHALAEQGNRAAFDKLKNLLQAHLQKIMPDCEYPEAIIDRIIHMHLPVLGTITKYAAVSVRKLQSAFVPWNHRIHGVNREIENKIISDIDFRKKIEPLVLYLKGKGINRLSIDKIFDMLIEGASIEMLARNPDPDIAAAAAYINKYIKGTDE